MFILLSEISVKKEEVQMKNNVEAEKRNQDLELFIQYLEEFFDELVDLENKFNNLNQKSEKRLNNLIDEGNSHYMSVNYQSKVSSLLSNANEIDKQIARTLTNINILLDDATKTRYWGEDEI